MKKAIVLLVICVLQSICFSQSKEKASNQLSAGVVGIMGSGSDVEFEFEQEELAFTFEFDHFLTKKFSLGLEANYLVFIDENEDEELQGELQPQAELTGVPVMLALKRYFWSSRFQPYLKVSGGPLLGWLEDEDEDEASTSPNQSESTKFKFGAAGGVFAGLDWRFLRRLGLNVQGGILFRHINSNGASTVTAQAGLLYRF